MKVWKWQKASRSQRIEPVFVTWPEMFATLCIEVTVVNSWYVKPGLWCKSEYLIVSVTRRQRAVHEKPWSMSSSVWPIHRMETRSSSNTFGWTRFSKYPSMNLFLVFHVQLSICTGNVCGKYADADWCPLKNLWTALWRDLHLFHTSRLVWIMKDNVSLRSARADRLDKSSLNDFACRSSAWWNWWSKCWLIGTVNSRRAKESWMSHGVFFLPWHSPRF